MPESEIEDVYFFCNSFQYGSTLLQLPISSATKHPLSIIRSYRNFPLGQSSNSPFGICIAMHHLLRSILALLDLASMIVAISPLTQDTPRYSYNMTWPSPSISTIQQELGRRLSKKALIYFPGSPGYINDTARWAANTESNFSVVVVPGIDRDVAATVC